MKFDLNKAVEQIKNNKDFLKLKKVIENNINHDNESTYDHCVRTYEVANKMINGHFITNKQANKKFNLYLDEQIDGVEKRDLMQITALIHDLGKIIVFDDNDKKRNLNITRPDKTTIASEHGYWGSVIVRDILSDTDLSEEIIYYLSKSVRLHAASFNLWLNKDLSQNELLWELKLHFENIHVEVIFNIYCDLFYGAGFKNNIHLPIELLNKSETYNKVKFSFVD